jgi:hypothetical protein
VTTPLRSPSGARLLLTASAASNVGDGLVRTAVPLAALAVTREPLLVAAMTAAGLLPWLVTAIPAGARIDRSDPGRVAVAAQRYRVVLVIGLTVAVAMGYAPAALLLAAVFAVGITEAMFDSSAMAAMQRLVDDATRVRGAAQLRRVQTIAGEVTGPVLAGWLFVLSAPAPFALAGLFAVVALVTATLVVRRLATRDGVPTMTPGGWRAGARWLRSSPSMRSVLAWTVTVAAVHGVVAGLLVLVVVDQLGLSPGLYGTVIAITIAGNIAGLSAAPFLARTVPTRTLVPALLVLTAGGVGGMAATRNALLLITALVAVEFAGGVLQVVSLAARQAAIPQGVFGRVNGCFATASMGAVPLGALGGGLVASLVGVPTALAVAAALSLAIAASVVRRPVALRF